MGILEYSSNNSGGSWWLDEADWLAMEKAGWVIHWLHDKDDPSHTHAPSHDQFVREHSHSYDEEHLLTKVTPNGEEWLGAKATSAAIETDDADATIAEWERVTGQRSSDVGCNCCGEPHNFTFTDNDGNKHWSYSEVVRTERKWSS